MIEVDEIVEEFLVESYEGLDQVDRDLVTLEKNPEDAESLKRVFRSVHTIKGTSGFLGYGKLEEITHVGENLLSKLRDEELVMNATITSALLSMVDAVRDLLKHIESTGKEGATDCTPVISQLNAALTGKTIDALEQPVAESPAPIEGAQPLTPALAVEPAAHEAVPQVALPAELEEAELAKVQFAKAELAKAQFAKAQLAKAEFAKAQLAKAQLAKATTAKATPAKAEPAKVAAAPLEPKQSDAVPAESAPTKTSVSDSNIRVDVRLLDKLMNLVGELVLARNQIVQFSTLQTNTAFSATSQRLNLITTELQEGVMKTRMQPIGNVWSKFPRIIRDLALTCGKQVSITMEGKETDLDKTIIEAIKDPLTHAVRNAVDHGIEASDVRVANGKPANGTLALRAFHEGGQVIIEISDDGAGIDPAKVKATALRRNVATASEVARMSDHEAISLVFSPGFSTATKVTNVSGRGVGMDVVRTSIEKIGGTVDLQSVLGQGTTLRIKIPLTLAIIPAMIVSSGDAEYAIPQVSLLELVRLEGEQAVRGIEDIHGAPVYRLRGRLLPLVYLAEQLQIAPTATNTDVLNIVVLQADDRQFGLVVDAINDTEEIVVKPLGKQLKGIRAFAGATIMGDGKVALILDVLGLAQRAGVVSSRHDGQVVSQQTRTDSQEATVSLLLFGLGDRDRMAIPLAMVERLEEFPQSLLERAGNGDVVQYRGEILPLIHLSAALNTARRHSDDDEPLQVIVHAIGSRSVGLVVDRILDIVEHSEGDGQMAQGGAIARSAIVQNHVTDIIDVRGVIERVDPALLQQPQASMAVQS